MKKSKKVMLQCVECERKYLKPFLWLEQASKMTCVCGTVLDVDEVYGDILAEKKESYLLYPRF
ncbi:hypothetical protein [Marinicella rhabdoformis]|uniref:hypothetical protein n=1 Tax=Marinicella rhabdoformis TaxID=2580566 RepID=UPI0012AEB772|nr:hypothetical protein [Marinicella rhabdoformis]